MVSVGEQTGTGGGHAPAAVRGRLYQPISRLSDWLEADDHQAYDVSEGIRRFQATCGRSCEHTLSDRTRNVD